MTIEVITLQVERRWQFTAFIKLLAAENLATFLFFKNITSFWINKITFFVNSFSSLVDKFTFLVLKD